MLCIVGVGRLGVSGCVSVGEGWQRCAKHMCRAWQDSDGRALFVSIHCGLAVGGISESYMVQTTIRCM